MARVLRILCDIALIPAAAMAILIAYHQAGLSSHSPEEATRARETAIPLLAFIGLAIGGHFFFKALDAPGPKRGGGTRRQKVDPINVEGLQPSDPNALDQIAELLRQRAEAKGFDVIDLVDDIIYAADFLGASDIHIEPKETNVKVAFRIDGVMIDVGTWPKDVEGRLGNRFKIMSKLDFARIDAPQDGRVQEKIHGKAMNLRVSVFPVLHGLKVVVRLLDSGAHALPPLERSGIHADVLGEFRRLIHAPQGMLLFTGPTGSGKTTVMYTALREVASGEVQRRNIVTLEDPIERILEEINQTQVDLKRGLTFAAGLRTILRQDPDVIMVGEIRDAETADIALRAGQTGHLLFSTLHTNSASAAFGRLIEMGLEPFLLSSSVTGVVGSRLVRRLCPSCRYRRKPPEALLAQLPGKLPAEFITYEGKGCPACKGTGYIGRMLVFELLSMNDPIREAVLRKQSAQEIQRIAQAAGMVPLLHDGLQKVHQGETSLVELLRVVQ